MAYLILRKHLVVVHPRDVSHATQSCQVLVAIHILTVVTDSDTKK